MRHHRLSQEQSEHACNELEHAYLSTLDRENEATNQTIPQASHYQAQVSEMRLAEQRSHLEAILSDQAASSDERIRALAESSRDQLVAARQWAEEQQSELKGALDVARAEGTELQQQMGRAKAEHDQLRAECAQYALRAQKFSAASDAAKTMISDLNSMAKQLEDKNLMLQASHEQHQLLTQRISQLQASLRDHQSRVAVLEGNLQREQSETSELTMEVQPLSGTIREMKTSWKL